jgi:hypothetical protein
MDRNQLEGIMRGTRFLSFLFLALSAAFFCVPDFRQALRDRPTGLSAAITDNWLESAGAIPPETLEREVRIAREHRDAKTLAFAAMHSPGGEKELLGLADEAVALDPQFTWIYPNVCLRLRLNEKGHNMPPQARQLMVSLQAWDPDNALPYLHEGEILFSRLNASHQLPNLDELAKETQWRSVMEKAFAAPRYDSYAQRQFDLDRSWLNEHHLAKPTTMFLMVAAYPLPNLLNIKTYSNLLNQKFGKEAEDAGHVPEAMDYYWKAAHMGEKIRLGGRSLIAELIGFNIQRDAYQRLIPVLRRSGQADQAASLQFVLDQTQQYYDSRSGKDPLAQSLNYNWAALMVGVFDALVLSFGVLTALSLVYVTAKRWARREKQGRLYQLVTEAQNYLPILLFLACLGLYLSYYPFAQNFHHYMKAAGQFHDLEPFPYNVFPSTDLTPGSTGLPIGNPLRPYVWFALAGMLIVALAQYPLRKRA